VDWLVRKGGSKAREISALQNRFWGRELETNRAVTDYGNPELCE